MRRVYQAAVSLFALGCSNAIALDAATVAAIDKAADAFVVLAGDSATTGQPPRQTDPAAKPLLDRVLNTSEVQHDVPPISELGDLSTWTVAVVKVGLVYTLGGSGVTKIEAIPNDPAVIEKLNHNAAVFAPEMGRYDAVMWLGRNNRHGHGILVEGIAKRARTHQKRRRTNSIGRLSITGRRRQHASDQWHCRRLAPPAAGRIRRDCS